MSLVLNYVMVDVTNMKEIGLGDYEYTLRNNKKKHTHIHPISPVSAF